MRARRRSALALLVTSAFALTSFQAARAGVITTEQYMRALDRDAAIARIDAVLAREEVQRELKRLGVDPADAAERVAALTDQELELLAANLEQLPAGGDLLGVVGVVFIVLVILELVGVINIFNKI